MEQLFTYKSKEVKIGNIPVGGLNPVRIQSMTSTNTMDTEATVAQSIRMIEAGCEYVRITAPGVKEAENLANIKKELKNQGYATPLIADIHYQPKAAEIAARIVEKVRINPGNYVDRKRGKLKFTESEYQAELDKIRERIKPLISICKDNGTAMRIGSNHGSISERILLKYGNTPAGMVESALEFVRICENLDYTNLVLSMKASNVKVMVHANRLLIKKMMEEGMNYPIHLGVTEAGDAEDGRIKSAAGIGPLLIDGIGDTIRVSLTEDPEFEIPVAKEIVQSSKFGVQGYGFSVLGSGFNPYKFSRRETSEIGLIGNGQPPVVIIKEKDFEKIEINESFEPDYLCTPDFQFKTKKGSFVDSNIKPINLNQIHTIAEGIAMRELENNNDLIMMIESDYEIPIQKTRETIFHLNYKKSLSPIILKRSYNELSKDDFLLKAAADCSYLLVDGLIDGIWLENNTIEKNEVCETAFGILQATGARISKAEFIACPSCGRTQFKIQDALQQIKKRTGHLKGIKIGVMGCCVNGPGEMADADYGYVGAGKSKITLYKSNRIVKQGINENEAVDELINLIKTDGKWID